MIAKFLGARPRTLQGDRHACAAVGTDSTPAGLESLDVQLVPVRAVESNSHGCHTVNGCNLLPQLYIRKSISARGRSLFRRGPAGRHRPPILPSVIRGTLRKAKPSQEAIPPRLARSMDGELAWVACLRSAMIRPLWLPPHPLDRLERAHASQHCSRRSCNCIVVGCRRGIAVRMQFQERTAARRGW